MNIKLRFFAQVREKLNTTDELVTLPDHVRTVGDVRQFLYERGGVWAEVFASGNIIRMAYEHRMTEPGTLITEGCEVAFFPPVNGG